MQQKDAVRLLKYLSENRATTIPQKNEFVKCINAFFLNDDPISNHFNKSLLESLNSISKNVLNESTGGVEQVISEASDAIKRASEILM